MEDWEDWENDDFIPVSPSKTSEQLKALVMKCYVVKLVI